MSERLAQSTSLRNSDAKNVESVREREYFNVLHNYRNDVYAVCGGRIHVALLTKIISVGVLPMYVLILLFMVYFGNATAIMFALIILGSVAITTVYGAFKGCKMCLVPFIFLQVVFFIYDLVLLGLFTIALLQSDSFALQSYAVYGSDSISPNTILLITSLVLLSALPPAAWIAYIAYLDILFIAEVDRGLELIRELNGNATNEDLTIKNNY
ncbi:unnamed protein product [Cylicocyclus nassatus]|uniref:Uncharacterized protein n=1 Tax=Cylicocyclus nassatus TaxID=53992 RepID=A0AA36HHJ6_CYLNA|nr:unnamed protein product [Cylicocyclus nassatus]